MSVGTVLVSEECIWLCEACEVEVPRPAMRQEPVSPRSMPVADRCPHCGQRALRPVEISEYEHGDPAGEPHAR